ncbi:MAG TPA: CAP domain-containing protein [Anaerolineae bacterium]|nr:CAP domain-containing protein [Anaerolineae bacterium]HQI83020.1 CAP domain-containing protein [Anaerolineae bacterium]
MNGNWFVQRNQRRDVWLIVGWLLIVALGIALVWYGFRPQATQTPPDQTTTSPVTAAPQLRPTVTLVPLPKPTHTLMPTNTPAPTATPLPPTPTPYIEAGADGVNVRSGPATTFDRLGYLDPGMQAPLTGRDGEWWQIAYNDATAYVYGPLVTPHNLETAAPVSPTVASEASPGANQTALADEIFQRINQFRADRGLAPCNRNPALEQAALLHAQDCAQRGELTHTGSDGSTVSQRVARAGYDAVGAAEITTTGDSAQAAMDWWTSEAPDGPHHSVLINPAFKDIGVAVVSAGNTYYFVALMAQPK